jgi:AraC-like DNA-binding protein
MLDYILLLIWLGPLLFSFWALAFKKTHKEVRFLLYCIIIVSVRSILPILHDLRWIDFFSPWVLPFTLLFTSFSINVGYFFYRYFNFLFYPLNKPKQSLWHFLPSMVISLNLVLAIFFKPDVVIKGNYYEVWFQLDLFIPMKLVFVIAFSTVLFYLVKIGIEVHRNIILVNKNFNGLKFLLIGMVSVLFVFFGVVGFDIVNKLFFDADFEDIAHKAKLAKPFFMLVFAFIFYRYPALLFLGSSNEIKTLGFKFWLLKSGSKHVNKPHEKLFSIEVIRNLILQIESVIIERQVFRNEKYSLGDLALAIQTPLAHLRFLFQEYCELSFVEYRNYHRVEDFKRCSQNKSENQNLTIEAIGGKCGFGSVNSLNRSIKKYENCTPSELWQREK